MYKYCKVRFHPKVEVREMIGTAIYVVCFYLSIILFCVIISLYIVVYLYSVVPPLIATPNSFLMYSSSKP